MSLVRWVINECVWIRIKRRRRTSPKRHTDEGKKDRGDSTYAKKRIGLFTAEEMKACIDEIKEVEQKAKDKGKKPVAVSLENFCVVDLRTLSGIRRRELSACHCLCLCFNGCLLGII